MAIKIIWLAIIYNFARGKAYDHTCCDFGTGRCRKSHLTHKTQANQTRWETEAPKLSCWRMRDRTGHMKNNSSGCPHCRARPPAALWEFGLVGVLPGLGVFWLISCSAFGATAHDAAYDAFMTLPAYTRTREHDGQPVVSASMREPTP